MKKSILTILISGLCVAAMAQKNTPKSYIEKFKGDAIKIMHETGVPASIVLGVAMHESACGNSVLAKNLNNQFGVKGDSRIVYYRNKKKVSTLYKHYNSVYDSYQDFARIMTERSEFSDLISKLTHFDYSGWAHGIQNHGYASDHKWAKGVLKIIEHYKLYNFDEHPEPRQMAQNNDTVKATAK